MKIVLLKLLRTTNLSGLMQRGQKKMIINTTNGFAV